MKAFIDPWENWDFTCNQCNWSGPGFALTDEHVSPGGCQKLCPRCNQNLEWLEFPLVSEMLANAGKLKPEELALAEQASKGHVALKTSELKSVDQLPDIDAEYIVLLWDEVGTEHPVWNREVVIRHGKDEIFRQEAYWEYYNSFIASCRILKRKYGYRLLDVMPTPNAWVSIHGDKGASARLTEEMRMLIGRDCYPPSPEEEANGSNSMVKLREAWENYNKRRED